MVFRALAVLDTEHVEAISYALAFMCAHELSSVSCCLQSTVTCASHWSKLRRLRQPSQSSTDTNDDLRSFPGGLAPKSCSTDCGSAKRFLSGAEARARTLDTSIAAVGAALSS